MRAMILAAGRGARMQALTVTTPKPLLRVGEHFLIEYAIRNLVAAGIREIVINISYHAEQIKQALGNGHRYGAEFFYSEEATALDTGGGILKALAMLGESPFIVMSADIITDYPLQRLGKEPKGLAHLILVENPSFHPQGDFGLVDNKLVLQQQPLFTYANLGIYRPELFAHCEQDIFPLVDLLVPAIRREIISGELYHGLWFNVGTPDDLIRAREDSNLRPLASETNTLSN